MSQVGHIVTGASLGFIDKIQGNTGAPVGPIANLINVVGDGITITIHGDPATHTLTASIVSVPFVVYTDVSVSPYVVLSTDLYVSVDCSLIPITIQLPDAPALYQRWVIKDRTGNASINNITVTTVTGAVLIDGNATFVINTDYEAINVVWNGTTYEVY